MKRREAYGDGIRVDKGRNWRASELRQVGKGGNSEIKGVTEVYGVFGRYDVMAHVEAPTLEELARIISDKMRGISGDIVNRITHNRLLETGRTSVSRG